MEIKKIQYITEQKRWEVTFVNEYTPFLLSEETIVQFELVQGKQLTDSLRDEILLFDYVQTYYHHALIYLKQRRTTKEVRDFLKKKEHLSDEAIHNIITLLEKQRYLDDYSYGKAYVHDQIHFQKKSLAAALQKLKEKGINSEQRKQLETLFSQDETMKQVEIDTLQKLILTLINKLKIYNRYERNQRIIAKLTQKGYNRDAIKQILEEYAEPILLDDYEKQQLFNKTKAKRHKMKFASQYAMYMKQYNITTEEVIDFFNNERMKHDGK